MYRYRRWSSEFDLHAVWAAKEAIFKKYTGEMTDPASEISILKINQENQTIQASYKDSTENLVLREFENAVLVWTI